jgi:signal transduction histidine kinase
MTAREEAGGASNPRRETVSIETTSHLEHLTADLERNAREELDPTTAAPAIDEEFPLQLGPATLASVCEAAVDEVSARFPDRTVEYAPDEGREGSGTWDARRVQYAATILLEDALKRTGAGEPVSLRWREHDEEVVLRVQFPRPLARGDRFVTYFEEGIRPDGADDAVGTLRLVVARKIALQHGGHLARVRTRAGTCYVVTLPRSTGRAA